MSPNGFEKITVFFVAPVGPSSNERSSARRRSQRPEGAEVHMSVGQEGGGRPGGQTAACRRARQVQVRGVSARHRRRGTTGKAPGQFVRRVGLDDDDTRVRLDERLSEHVGSGTELEDDVGGSNPGLDAEASCQAPIKLAPPPPQPAYR